MPENALKEDPTIGYQLTEALNLHAHSSGDINITKA